MAKGNRRVKRNGQGPSNIADAARQRPAARPAAQAVPRGASRRAAPPTRPIARAQRRARAAARLATARSHNPHAYSGRLTLPGVSRAAEKTLRGDMQALRGARGNRTLLIDNKTGAVVHDAQATPISAGRTGGRIFVRAGGPVATFSSGDYREMTRTSAGRGARTAVIVAHDGMAVLQARKDGTGKYVWPDFDREIAPVLTASFRAHQDAVRAQIARAKTKTQQIALERISSRDILQQAWKDAARMTGMRYAQVGHSGRRTYNLDLQDHVFDAIASGRKTVEGRLGSDLLKTVRKGDVLNFNDGRMHVEVTSAQHFTRAHEMAQAIGARRLGFHPKSTAAGVGDFYRKLYWYHDRPKAGIATIPEGSAKHGGWLAFGVKPTHADRQYEPLPGIGRTRGRATPKRGGKKG